MKGREYLEKEYEHKSRIKTKSYFLKKGFKENKEVRKDEKRNKKQNKRAVFKE